MNMHDTLMRSVIITLPYEQSDMAAGEGGVREGQGGGVNHVPLEK